MPRISLYKPERGKDYTFIDRQINEMFTVGGTDLHIHKYLGPENTNEADATADQPRYDKVTETNIQDLLFLENRDRKYDKDIYTIRGIYNVQDNDFNLSQFGIFLENDTLFLTIHINSSVKTLGRKLMSGDVIELPHLKDEYALNDFSIALKRFYVVEDVNRASEGFSPTWYPHLYRVKIKQIVDSQEFKEILDLPADEDNPAGDSLRDLMSTYKKELEINEAVVDQAEADAPKSGYDTSHYYSVQVNSTETGSDVQVVEQNGENVVAPPAKSGYDGYLLGDDNVPNGASFGHGIQFPSGASEGDYFLRTDFRPKRMFRYDGSKWVKLHDSVRMTMTNSNDRLHQKGTFINNNNYTYNDKVADGLIILTAGDTVIDTKFDYPVTNGNYVVLKFETVEMSYAVADNAGMITDNNGKIRITLPGTDSIQYTGQWNVLLYANRVEERQSLSKALRPQADN